MDTALLVSIISAVAGLGSAAFTWRTSRRATDSGERVALAQIEAGAYARAQQAYEAALGRMQAELDRQSVQIDVLQRQVSRLIRQVRDAGLVPVTSSEEQ